MAEHYNLAILPARVRKPKDKPNVEGSVGKISTWITAALRNEQFFSLAELNASIREKDVYKRQPIRQTANALTFYLMKITIPRICFWQPGKVLHLSLIHI